MGGASEQATQAEASQQAGLGSDRRPAPYAGPLAARAEGEQQQQEEEKDEGELKGVKGWEQCDPRSVQEILADQGSDFAEGLARVAVGCLQPCWLAAGLRAGCVGGRALPLAWTCLNPFPRRRMPMQGPGFKGSAFLPTKTALEVRAPPACCLVLPARPAAPVALLTPPPPPPPPPPCRRASSS